MNQKLTPKQTNFKFKMPVIILSVVSLILVTFSCITYFVNYDYNYNDGESYYELMVSFPSFFDLLDFVIYLAPFVLFAIYILKFHKNYKATICVPITFGLIAFYPIYNAIYPIYYTIVYDLRDLYTFRDLIFDIPIIITFTLLTISALKGMSKKVFVIIASICGLLVEAHSIINLFNLIERYINKELYLYLFTRPIGIVGSILFYVSILLFGLKNRIPSIIATSPEKEKKNAETMSPEQSLRLLKDKLELGMITQEEYQAQRAEIISKL